MKNDLIKNVDKVHTTRLGNARITKNFDLEGIDVAEWCREKILNSSAVMSKIGKNWYIKIDDIIITINANNYSIITAHKLNEVKEKEIKVICIGNKKQIIEVESEKNKF